MSDAITEVKIGDRTFTFGDETFSVNDVTDAAVNTVRSVLGQGLAMGWGDEAEAWLRSKLGDEEYEKALAKIRSEYGTFAEESPGLQMTGEFVGGAIPAVAAMLVPGGQPAAAAATARLAGPLSRLYGLTKPVAERTMRQNLARLGTVGAVQGSVAGAGSAQGDRTSGALTGGGFGLTTGLAFPLAGSALRTFGSRIRDLAGVSPERAKQWAAEKLNLSLDGESPASITAKIQRDIDLGVPPAVANVTPGTIDLAEAVVQRGGQPSRDLAEIIEKQKAGGRERVAAQVRQGVGAKNFYETDKELAAQLRRNAQTAYDAAYSVGKVDDPVINMILQEPEFKDFFERGRLILRKKRLAATLDSESDPSKYELTQLYDPQTGKIIDIPDVRTLDYIKQGIDEKIGELFSDNKSSQAYGLKEVYDKFVNRLDELVPEYKAARAQYKGDVEILDALHMGRENFKKMDPEQVQAFFAKASKGEKDAFRTGVARNLWDQIMTPSMEIDAARRLIGSPKTRQALDFIFETPAQRDLFMTALEREMELFKGANKILSGSPTARREATRERLESRPGVAEAAVSVMSGGWMGSMMNGLMVFLSKGVPDEYYQELTNLLRSGKPDEIAAVVQTLENAAKKRAPRAAATGATEAALVGGTLGLAPPAPATEEEKAIFESLGIPTY